MCSYMHAWTYWYNYNRDTVKSKIVIYNFCFVQGDTKMAMRAYYFGRLCHVIMSSLNFFLYCMTGKRFRKELRKILRCTPDKQKSSSTATKSRTTTSSVSTTATLISTSKSWKFDLVWQCVCHHAELKFIFKLFLV